MREAAVPFSSQDLTAVFPEALTDLARLQGQADFAFLPDLSTSRYLVGFALSERAAERVFRLRYQVFNLELGEGLSESHATGLDRDRFDPQMTHLVLVDRQRGKVLGTYRLQTAAQAAEGEGIYSAQEFDFAPLAPLLDHSVECGRACIAREHRNFRTIFLLWAGIAAFMNLYRQRYLFGCCSLTSTDPDDGWRALKTLRRKSYLHPDIWLLATPPYSCGPAQREYEDSLGAALPLPKLFRSYMTLGARVVSEPALDREFKTVDFLVMLDTRQVHMSRLDLVL